MRTSARLSERRKNAAGVLVQIAKLRDGRTPPDATRPGPGDAVWWPSGAAVANRERMANESALTIGRQINTWCGQNPRRRDRVFSAVPHRNKTTTCITGTGSSSAGAEWRIPGTRSIGDVQPPGASRRTTGKRALDAGSPAHNRRWAAADHRVQGRRLAPGLSA